MNILSEDEIESLTSKLSYTDNNSGIVGVYCEEGYPFYYASDEYVKMLGYKSLDEMVEEIDDNVVNTIHEDDLKQVVLDIGAWRHAIM